MTSKTSAATPKNAPSTTSIGVGQNAPTFPEGLVLGVRVEGQGGSNGGAR